MILGLDIPFKRNLGIALIDHNLNVIKCETVRIPESCGDDEALDWVWRIVQLLILCTDTRCIALERSQGGGYAGLRSRLNEFQGIIKLASYQTDTDVIEVSPGTMKKQITGHGRASKDQMRKSLVKSYPELSDRDEHSLDALAVAICAMRREL